MKRGSGDIEVSDRLAALSEMVRVRLCRVLERKELSVGEAAAVVQMPQSTVSRHLKVLCEAGWLLKRAEGPATLYRLVLDDLPIGARGVWLAVRESVGESAETREDMRRLEAVLAERRTDSQSFFGRVAGAWDEVRNELFGAGFTANALLSLLPGGWTVVDAGCGTGNVSELLAPVVRRVIALDESAVMLKAAKKRLEGVKNVEFVRGLLDEPGIEEGSVDAVVCALVLHHVPEPRRAVGALAGLLKEGGVLLVIDMVAHDREEYRRSMGHKHLGFSEGEAGSMLEGAGLEGVRVRAMAGEAQSRGPSLFVATGKRGKGGKRRGKQG